MTTKRVVPKPRVYSIHDIALQSKMLMQYSSQNMERQREVAKDQGLEESLLTLTLMRLRILARGTRNIVVGQVSTPPIKGRKRWLGD